MVVYFVGDNLKMYRAIVLFPWICHRRIRGYPIFYLLSRFWVLTRRFANFENSTFRYVWIRASTSVDSGPKLSCDANAD